MAMRTTSPWWVSLVFGVGLFFVFIGERLLASVDGMHEVLTGAGVILVFGTTAMRGWAVMSSTGNRRRVELTLLACQLTAIVAILLYSLTTGWGPESLHGEHALGNLTVLWTIAMVAGVVPLLMIEASLGIALRTKFERAGDDDADDAGVEFYRVRELGWSGLTVAFALSMLMVTCNVAKERNVQKDVSYFKTSSPGESTVNIVKNMTDPLHVYLYFPEVSEVKEQVLSYFEQLKDETGKVEIALKDRYADPALAEKHHVARPLTAGVAEDKGQIVLVRGEGDAAKISDKPIEIELEMEKARKQTGKLRNLDKDVNERLGKISRDKRKIYFTKGHGELNDVDVSLGQDRKAREIPMNFLKQVFVQIANYEIKDLSQGELKGGKEVPDDATIVFVLGAERGLDEEEWETLDRYVARGGRMMIAMDPRGAPSMGALEGRLGIKFDGRILMDDKNSFRGRPEILQTTNFTIHATTTQLTAHGSTPIQLLGAGSLEEIQPTAKDAPKKTVIIQSSDTTWQEQGKPDGVFDAATEKRQKWKLGIVAEGPKVGDKEGYRVAVFSDVENFADVKPTTVQTAGGAAMVNGPSSGGLALDVIRWLGGEEVFVGEIVNEDDKPISHGAVWFTLTTIGGPFVVLVLGLVGTYWRKRRYSKSSAKSASKEVTP